MKSIYTDKKELLLQAIESNNEDYICKVLEEQNEKIDNTRFKREFLEFDDIIAENKVLEPGIVPLNHYRHREQNNTFLLLKSKTTQQIRLFCYNPEIEIEEYQYLKFTYSIGVTTLRDFHNLIEHFYPEKEVDTLRKQLSTKAADEILTDLLKTGVDFGATDLYLNVLNKEGEIIYKIDGFNIKKGILGESQTKRVLDIVMNHSGQSQKSHGEIKGKLDWQVRGKMHSFRLSIGKKSSTEQIMVLRFLSSYNPNLNLQNLGFYQEHISKIEEMATLENGIVFVTGSTGEGKSTTMGVILNQLAIESKKMVFTIEDPVEVNNPNIVQYQVQEDGDEKYHMSFSDYSKLLKRQNPDIVLLGEARDKEEIEECIKMSKAGQLVFTTLHSASTSQTLSRLSEEGITKGDLVDSLRGILSQKLYPKLCKCKREIFPGDKGYCESEKCQEYPEIKQYRANRIGCQICRDKNKGFDGKTLIYEIKIFEGLNNNRLEEGAYFVDSMEIARRRFLEGHIEYETLEKIRKTKIK